jgi:hypothetical protein
MMSAPPLDVRLMGMPPTVERQQPDQAAKHDPEADEE